MVVRKEASGCENRLATSAELRIGCWRKNDCGYRCGGKTLGRTVMVLSRMGATTLEIATGDHHVDRAGRWAYGVTAMSLDAKKGSRTHKSGTFPLSRGSPIY